MGMNRMNVVKNNTFVAQKASQRIANFISDEGTDGIKRLGAIDSNYYCRPADPDMIMHCSYRKGASDVRITYSLGEWQKNYGLYDQHSKPGPVSFGYKVNALGKPQKITYGFYCEGKDIWFEETPAEQTSIEKIKGELTGVSDGLLPAGMNKWLILSMDIDFGKNKEQKYLLRFETKGAKTGEIIKANFKTRDNQIVCSREFQLKSDFQKNEVLYIPTFANIPHERVNFEFSDPQASVWITNISFQKADVTLPNLTDRFLLLVNDSNNPKVFPVKKGFVDVAGNHPGESIVINPYSSKMLFKK